MSQILLRTVPQVGVAPHHAVSSIDPAVKNAIGEDETLDLITPHGNANWANTFHVVTRSRRGLRKHYFLKLVSGSLAWERVLGEYSGMVELHQTLPDLIPKPYSAGRCQNSDVCYFLSEFVPIHHQTPDASQLGAKIAELHRSSTSPTGKFGFFTTPFDGRLPLIVDWESSWTTFFKKLLKGVYDLDVQYNGEWEELHHAMELTLHHVIPRLLEPLESHGRQVKPCLIHGDLWEDNIGTHVETGQILLIDPAPFYAHHEMGVAMWRVSHHNMSSPKYRVEYFKNYKPDEPVSECDDRNRLYSLKETLMYSALKPGNSARKQALRDMEYLIEKFVTVEHK